MKCILLFDAACPVIGQMRNLIKEWGFLMKKTNAHTRRLVSWLEENEKDWKMICGIGEQNITIDEFVRLWKLLEDNGFYEVTIVMFTVHYSVIEERIAQNLRVILSILEDVAQRRGEEQLDCAEMEETRLQ